MAARKSRTASTMIAIWERQKGSGNLQHGPSTRQWAPTQNYLGETSLQAMEGHVGWEGTLSHL